ncbi:uncharacterized protein M421DRAFT_264243 [Didymella exigua CBS 183.55]|uniref:Uncharacterized protein n=1 Tax=Didymella exigua CBS 183.55 TaxID=1150837 RepID=A0A6A5RC13_9PLEO|nr:uncharacterized protein M421DRAFT_264243 [Didymella exigua CBS 183.55]KAF1925073.1 hypothetical protein M421DRAFT_264243 [Didymella exigua CBS 183.55]
MKGGYDLGRAITGLHFSPSYVPHLDFLVDHFFSRDDAVHCSGFTPTQLHICLRACSECHSGHINTSFHSLDISHHYPSLFTTHLDVNRCFSSSVDVCSLSLLCARYCQNTHLGLASFVTVNGRDYYVFSEHAEVGIPCLLFSNYSHTLTVASTSILPRFITTHES